MRENEGEREKERERRTSRERDGCIMILKNIGGVNKRIDEDEMNKIMGNSKG